MGFHRLSTGVLDKVVRQIEEKVLDGSWGGASERLPAERALAQHFGVSRPTVREAIRHLVSKGMLETKRGSGVYVVRKQPAALTAPWLQLVAEQPPLREETLEFRMVFECAAARFAAARSTPAEISRLETVLARMHDAVIEQDVAEEARMDCEFHTVLMSAAHNRMLGQFYASVITMLREHIAANTFDATVNNANAAVQCAQRMRQHESIFLSVRERNPDAAQQAMFTHIDFVGRQFFQFDNCHANSNA
ncbi:FadR family transcriptional regulator [Trinickia dabaoshanensis]|uniref:FadR family transcriptional regulator n=1 Tax=Trinickia dabaoshanensis TaxID=564714 RepID=A0A2N7VIB0_9BURK|nr:FadR/GntR family transcriptional regulator [Trinickia dabaoshanensis]PMS16896.1 FadR family transcriptional regulator [Trinickia dabaoshanensis]